MPKIVRLSDVTRSILKREKARRKKKRSAMRREFSPDRQYGANDAAERSGVGRFFSEYVSPAIAYTARGAGRVLKKLPKWTYKNVVVPSARLTGRYSPTVGGLAVRYIVSPTYSGAKYIGSSVGRATKKHVLSPIYEGIKHRAIDFHNYMLADDDVPLTKKEMAKRIAAKKALKLKPPKLY